MTTTGLASHLQRANEQLRLNSFRSFCTVGQYEVLGRRYTEAITRIVLRQRLDDATARRRNRLWGVWAHNVRVILFLVRIMRPYRRHLAMERGKHFIEVAWKG